MTSGPRRVKQNALPFCQRVAGRRAPTHMSRSPPPPGVRPAGNLPVTNHTAR